MALSAAALTTLATLKAELGITDSAQDTALERRVEAASEAIANYCGRTLHYSAEVSESRVPPYGQRLAVDRTPLVSVASITLYGTVLDSSDYVVESAEAGLIFRRYGWGTCDLWRVGTMQQPVVGTARPDALVTVYAGGYVTPGQVTQSLARTLPYDLEEACIATAVSLHRKAGRDQTVASEALGPWSASYGGLNSAIGRGIGGIIPDSVIPILNRYRRIR